VKSQPKRTAMITAETATTSISPRTIATLVRPRTAAGTSSPTRTNSATLSRNVDRDENALARCRCRRGPHIDRPDS
jgi:hypothetical protein